MTSAFKPEGIHVFGISLINPSVRAPKRLVKFHVKVKFDGTTKTTVVTRKNSPRGNCVTWDESFSFAGDITDDSTIVFNIIKNHWIPSETLGSCEKKVLDLLQLQAKSGVCKLDIAKGCQLVFNIERLSTILPDLITETLERSHDIPALEGPSRFLAIVSSTYDIDGEVNETWTSFLTQFQTFMNAMDTISEVNSYAKLAWSILSVIPKTILSQKGRNDSVKQLCEKLNEVYDYVVDAERLPWLSSNENKTLSVMVQQTVECAYFIRAYCTENIVEKIWKGASIEDKIKAFNDKFDHLMTVMTGSITLETNIVTLRVSQTFSEIKDLNLLGEMPYARDAGFVWGKRCLSGTREKLINNILEWVNSDTPQQILVLSGQAGTGKSAVAHTIAELFRKQNRLGSLFCFNRSYKDRRNFLFSNISRDLADSDTSWRQTLVRVIERTALRTSADPETQFNEFIIKPSKEVETIGPVVIVVDALDESGDRRERKILLKLLLEGWRELPGNYRLIVTSRPEPDIELGCKQSTVFCQRMADISPVDTLNDIRYFVSSELSSVAHILDEECRMDWCSLLARQAEGYFQWADIACRFIDPTVEFGLGKRFKTVISKSASSLYELYHQILDSQPEFNDEDFFTSFKAIIAAIIVAREPLSTTSLQFLFRDTIQNVFTVLQPVHSLFVGIHGSDALIRPLHTSLTDFFANAEQKAGVANRYYIDTSDHSFMALGCLKLLNRMLCFNICNLETSHRRNGKIPNLTSLVKEAIPADLSYACRFWALHLRSSKFTEDLLRHIRTLMLVNVLYLFEALSLLDEMDQGCVAMKILAAWCEDIDNELAGQALDAWQFGYDFGQVMTDSTPHLYLSALPFAPSNSFISKQYLPLYPQLLNVDVGQPLDSPIKNGIMKRNVSANPTALAFSSQCRHVATGFKNGEFWVWDYETGEKIYQMMPQDYGIEVCDVAFSPNGDLVYCCFIDGSIQIWDSKTNDTHRESYQNLFDGECRYCQISSDGCYVVFHVEDAILLYDRKSGLKPIRFGADNWFRSILSPNGDLLAFVRADNTICLWNTRKQAYVTSWPQSGECWIKALTDKYIAFGVHSRITEVWDIEKNQKINQFELYLEPIALSSNNQFLFSISATTYSIWDISTGQLITKLALEEDIQIIRISPDSKFIGLGTYNYTIYVRQWDALVNPTTPGARGYSIVHKLWLHNQYLVLVYAYFGTGCYYLQISDITTMNDILFKVEINKQFCVAVSSKKDNHLHVAYTSSSGLHLWNDIAGDYVLDESERNVTSLAFSPAGTTLISGNSAGVINVWDIYLRRMIGRPFSVLSHVDGVAFSSTGTNFLVAYTTLDKRTTIEVRDCRSGSVLRGPFKIAQPRLPLTIAFSTNETRIVCVSSSGMVVLDAITGKGESIHSFRTISQLSPDRRYLAWKHRDRMRLWDIEDGMVLTGPWSNYPVHSFGFSNDSSRVITLHSTDETRGYIDILDIQTGRTLTSYRPIHHSPRFWYDTPSLALDENHFVLAIDDSIATVWNLDVHRIMSPLYQHHLYNSEFGALPLSHLNMRQSRQTFNITHCDEMGTLTSALTAWDKALFSEFAEMDDGWILGPHDELLFWVPKAKRKCLWFPCMTHAATEDFTKLSFDNFVHGSRWVECNGGHKY